MMLVTNCLRTVRLVTSDNFIMHDQEVIDFKKCALQLATLIKRPTGTIIRHIKTLVPEAYAVIEDSAKTLINKVNHKLFGPEGEEVVKDVDLKDKYCLITGANSGIGLEMTRCLNARDCHVLMACRNTYAADIASKRVCKNSDRLTINEVNLASLRSVKQFTDRMLTEEREVDIVILNAGVFGIPRILTEDGLETIFQVNHLSQIYLLMNIEKLLAPDARVVFITSESHRYVHWPLQKRLLPNEDMLSLSKEDYTSIRAFNTANLCNNFATHYLAYRWGQTQRGVFAATPGSFVKTKLCNNWWAYELLYQGMQPFNKSIKQAAATPLYCATSPQLEGQTGFYVKDCRREEPSELSQDSHLTFRLWDMTQRMIDERVRDFEVARLEAEDKPESQQTDKTLKEPIEELISNYSG